MAGAGDGDRARFRDISVDHGMLSNVTCLLFVVGFRSRPIFGALDLGLDAETDGGFPSCRCSVDSIQLDTPLELLLEVFASGWNSPLLPSVTAFRFQRPCRYPMEQQCLHGSVTSVLTLMPMPDVWCAVRSRLQHRLKQVG